MEQYIYFLFGILCMMAIIKMLLPAPKVVKLHPTLDNYKDVVYVDEVGKIYKYDLITLP